MLNKPQKLITNCIDMIIDHAFTYPKFLNPKNEINNTMGVYCGYLNL